MRACEGVGWHNRNGLARWPHADSLDRSGRCVANFVPNGRQHPVQRPRRFSGTETGRRRIGEANGEGLGVRKVSQSARELRLARCRILDDRDGRVAQPARAIERMEVRRVHDEHKRHKDLNGGDRRDDRGADPRGETKAPNSPLITPAALSPGLGS